MGHLISSQYGIKGLDIAREAWYNVYGNEISNEALISYLEKNISEYAVKIKKRGKVSIYKEILPEIISKNSTNADDFTKEFIRLVKEEKI